jgi:hypothetical protein
MSASQFPPLQSTTSTKRCTNCSTLMSLYTLPSHYGRTVDIDVCHDCNALWFDQSESTQLSPDGTVALFQLINERGGTSTNAAAKFGEGLRCVSCGTGMRLMNDRVKNTRFAYQSCPSGHGRLTTFYNFLAEKQFVRELTQTERAKLAVNVQQIKCSSCAAPVEIGKTDACTYCRAPVSVFDRDAAKKAIDHYLAARQQQPATQASGYGYGSGTGSGSSSSSIGSAYGYGGGELAADILFALGRAASRGLGQAGSRAAPAAIGAAGAAGAAGAVTGSALADTGTAASGGLLESIGSMPTATDALFAASGGAGAPADSAAGALPSATDALFGASAGATDAGGGFLSELGGLFSSSAASGAGAAVSDTFGSGLESIGGSLVDSAGDVVAASSGGLVDLVSDGIGSLLGSIFD